MILVSVLITCYNAETTIIYTLESIFNQTFKDFEVIIVDDGSNDNTHSLVRDWLKNNPTANPLFKLFVIDRSGRGKALNYGVQRSIGQWIAICDADDIWHPEKLSLQAALINKMHTDVIGTKYVLFSGLTNVSFRDLNHDISHIRYNLADFLVSNKISHSSVIIRKNLCVYDDKRFSQLDYELWLRLLSAGKEIVSLQQSVTFHRIHKGQSFEGKMGKLYRWRSFKLKAYYCILNYNILLLSYNFAKLLFDLSIPRTIRFKLRQLVIRK